MTPTLDELLAKLSDGSASHKDLYGLSNLSRQQAETAWAVCITMPAEERQQLFQNLVEIAENDFEVNFDTIFHLGIDDLSPGVRQAAIEGLWESEDIRLVPRIAKLLLHDPVPDVQAAAATLLGRFVLLGELEEIRERPHKQALHALLDAAATDHVEVRRRAIESLAYSATDPVPDLIQAAYDDPDDRLRISAVFAMGRSVDTRWAANVMRELFNPSPEMRFEAARACGELELQEAVDHLIELIDDVDAEVQQAAIWALGQINSDDAQAALEDCTESDDEAISEAAWEALRELEFLHGDLGAFLLFDLFREEDDEGEEPR